MPTTYGPKSSPYGRNQALDAYAKKLVDGEVPVTLESARAVMSLVGEDGRLTVEESQAIDPLHAVALDARDQAAGHTELGRRLLVNYVSAAQGRLFAYQVNSDLEPMNAWLRMMSFGLWSLTPTSVGLDQSPHPGRGTVESIDEAAFARTISDVAGSLELERLLEEFPAAVARPGSTSRGPTPHPDVQREYDRLKEDLRRGRAADENDPMAPLRAYLEARYG